jgi:putative MATE family efflux protein
MTNESQATDAKPQVDGAVNGVESDRSNGAAVVQTAPVDGGAAGNGGGAGLGGGGWNGRGRGGGRGGGGPGRRRDWMERDLTSGSIPKNLWGMAWPQATEGVLRVVDQILDLVWAGVLGTVHIAGIGVAQQYTQTAWSARQGIDTAQRAMVARAVGMGNMPLAQLTVFQATTVTTIFWLAIAAVGIIFTEPMLQVLGVSEEVMGEAVPYMRIQFMGQGFMSFQQLFSHALVASGDPITPMKAQIVSRVLHGVLSPFLVFGLFGFPEMGIAGAATANAAGNATAAGLVTLALSTGRSRLHVRWGEFKLDATLIKQIGRIGLPAAINGAERSVAQLLLVVFVTPFGDDALAAFALSRRIEMFANLGSQGFGQASGVIVGQNLGAGNPERARQTILWGVGYVMAMKSLVVAFLFLFPDVFLLLFTRDEALLDLASTWIRIQCLGYIALGSSQVFQQSFMTAGATFYPMMVTLLALWVIELPLAYVLSDPMGMGQFGVAWAITVAGLVRPICYVPYFLSGRWMRAKVFTDQNIRRAGQSAEMAFY